MSGKLAVALLVLFCVGQVYPASLSKAVPVPPNENLSRTAIDDIIHQLNILIARIGQGIGELGHLIADLERRVAEAITELDVSQILNELGNQIENIIQEAGVTVDEAADCVDQSRESVENLLETTVVRLRQCLQPIRPAREQLQQQISNIASLGAEIISFISSGIGNCFHESDNPGQMLHCLSDLEESATSSTNALVSRIGEAVEEDRELINELVEELTVCVQSVTEEVNNQQQDILNNLSQCISEIGSETTTETTPESTTETTAETTIESTTETTSETTIESTTETTAETTTESTTETTAETTTEVTSAF